MSLTSLLSIGAILSMVSLVFTQLIANKFKSKIRSQVKKVNLFSIRTMLYVLFSILFLTIPAFLFFAHGLPERAIYTIVFFYALLLGILHCVTHYKYVKWAEKSVDVLPDMLFTTIVAIMGTVAFMALTSWVVSPDRDRVWVYLFIMLPFVIGMYVMKALMLFKDVDGFRLDYPMYKVSQGNKQVSPEERRHSRRIDVTCMMPMDKESEELTPVECKLLSDIEFGINIFQLVRKHNGKSEFQDIATHDVKGDEYEYLFYLKPKWLGVKKFIDPEINVVRNRISTKDVIICQRHSLNVED